MSEINEEFNILKAINYFIRNFLLKKRDLKNIEIEFEDFNKKFDNFLFNYANCFFCSFLDEIKEDLFHCKQNDFNFKKEFSQKKGLSCEEHYFKDKNLENKLQKFMEKNLYLEALVYAKKSIKEDNGNLYSTYEEGFASYLYKIIFEYELNERIK